MAELTDLPMIKEGRADKLKAAGIDTIEKLWKADLGDLAEHPLFTNDGGFLGQLPLLQGYAEAHAKNAPIVYAEDPRIFDMDPVLHMDLEFDGPAREIFLYGFMWHHEKKPFSWFDHTRAGQKQLLLDFQALCKEHNPTVVTWGGKSSDTVQLRNACEKYKLSTKWIDEVRWYDLQNDLVYTGSPETQRVYLPVRKFKSDQVAAYFGYKKPKLNVKDGYGALLKYRSYRRKPTNKLKQDLIDYNAEDVVHLQIVLNGMRKLMRH